MSSRMIHLFNDQALRFVNAHLENIEQSQSLAEMQDRIREFRDALGNVGMGDELPAEDDDVEVWRRMPHEHMAVGLDSETGHLFCQCGFVQPKGDNKWVPKDSDYAKRKARRR